MKFIIDIPEKDAQSCYNCPFNYDFVACVAPNGPDYADICDCIDNPYITTRPEGCPLVPVVPDQGEMDRKWPETVAGLKPCPFCGGEAEFMYVSGLRHPWSGVQADALAVTVCCVRCGGTIPSKLSTKSAIDAWNRRADHD